MEKTKSDPMQVGDLVSPLYYLELCDTVHLEDMNDTFVLNEVGVLLAIVVDDRYHECINGPAALICQVLSPRGISGWVCGKHISVLAE